MPNNNDTIFALSTPFQKSALCVFRVSGIKSHNKIKEIINCKKLKLNEPNLCYLIDKNKNKIEKTFCCFHSNARDFSKLGLLMLGRGSVFGKRVVDSKYIDWLTETGGLKDIDGDESVDYYARGWWVAEVLEMPIIYARGFNGQYVVVIPELDLVFVRLGLKENEKSVKNNDFKMSDNLKFFVEQVIKDYSL